jgi:hypothetical protein
MREFINVVSKSVFAICPKPGKANLKLIARQANKTYPASFSDLFCGELLAGGYESLTRSLVVKFENLNRRDIFNKVKRQFIASSSDIDEPPKRKIVKSDQYGCVNWQPPTLPDDETIETQKLKKENMIKMVSIHVGKAIHEVEAQEFLQQTYYSQRVDINNLMPMYDLKN